MSKAKGKYVIVTAVFAFIVGITTGFDARAAGERPVKQIMAQDKQGKASAASPAAQLDGKATAVEVDGSKLTNAEINTRIEQRLAQLGGQIPPERLEEARAQLRKEVIDGFVNLTLLTKEIAAKKIVATDKEVTAFIDKIKGDMPPGQSIDEFLKNNNMDMAKLREEIANNIKITKLIALEAGGKLKATEKDIADFYTKNTKMFQKPESVHARHILIASDQKDNEKTKSQKLAKAEDIRKKLVAGGDFAQLAAQNSDCPSKEKGGDLGTFGRGQMVKSFEDAAFSQAPKAIGPVVKTDFGFHIIQVLEHTAAETVKLDADMKKKIGSYLERQKQEEAFGKLMKRLKASANIVIHG